jgi:nitrate reductase NapAB chaperone NapD
MRELPCDAAPEAVRKMICSYLVVSEPGASAQVADRLTALAGCEVVAAENQDVLILVTDTVGLEEESALRRRVEAMDGIQALLLTFGEIDPDTRIGDPIRVSEGGRSLPVLDATGRGGALS